jgi:hypothetical protein
MKIVKENYYKSLQVAWEESTKNECILFGEYELKSQQNYQL